LALSYVQHTDGDVAVVDGEGTGEGRMYCGGKKKSEELGIGVHPNPFKIQYL
jgi:hypothetical protein